MVGGKTEKQINRKNYEEYFIAINYDDSFIHFMLR